MMNQEIKIKAAVVTVSDSRNEKSDVSGEIITELLTEFGAEIVGKIIVSDDFEKIVEVLKNIVERESANLIITTGGTGLAPRDNTPEATRAVIERETQGISEALRYKTIELNPMAMLSRATSGIAKKTLIINFPGSPKGVKEYFEVVKPILNHAVNLISGNTKHCE